MVRLPGAANVVVWDGPANAAAVAAVTDPPCRRRIADRLLAGDAAVWVLLQCGRRDEDDAAADRVQQELNRMSADGQPPLTCSLVRVSRIDPAEKLLAETLLCTEPDLHGRDEPMAFPVFGRGRVLYALVGAGVNADNVRHTLDFLVGGCSCTIKRQNPGVDLLLTADWSVIAPTTPEEAPTTAAPADEIVPLTPLPRKAARPVTSEAVAGRPAGLTFGWSAARALRPYWSSSPDGWPCGRRSPPLDRRRAESRIYLTDSSRMAVSKSAWALSASPRALWASPRRR